MANPEHLEILKQGVEVWNEWRKKNPDLKPDLSGAILVNTYLHRVNLRKADLFKANLSEAILDSADLREADLREASLFGTTFESANLRRADLRSASLVGAFLDHTILVRAKLNGADLWGASLEGAYLIEADLRDTNLFRAYFWGAHLKRANLERAMLRYACLVNADLRGAIISNSPVYGISAWDIRTDEKTRQESLLITPWDENGITVDDLEIAQFLYMVINNEKLGHFVKVMRTSAVLILGSFGNDQSQALLEKLKKELSARGFIPIIFNFDISETNFPMETVRTLALLSNFIVIDLSEPAGQLAEMAALVPDTFVPFIQIACEGSHVTWMLKGPQSWVSKIIRYSEPDLQDLPAFIEKNILPCAKEINGQLYDKRKQMWD